MYQNVKKVKSYIWEYNQVYIVIKGKSYDMKDKYLNCQVEDYRPEYGFDYDTGEIDFNDMYVAIDLRC